MRRTHLQEQPLKTTQQWPQEHVCGSKDAISNEEQWFAT